MRGFGSDNDWAARIEDREKGDRLFAIEAKGFEISTRAEHAPDLIEGSLPTNNRSPPNEIAEMGELTESVDALVESDIILGEALLELPKQAARMRVVVGGSDDRQGSLMISLRHVHTGLTVIVARLSASVSSAFARAFRTPPEFLYQAGS